jgi:hypothetical protein
MLRVGWYHDYSQSISYATKYAFGAYLLRNYGGTDFGFDIWNDWSGWTLGGVPIRLNVFDLTQRSIRPHSVTVHSADAWKNRSGSYSITLQIWNAGIGTLEADAVSAFDIQVFENRFL